MEFNQMFFDLKLNFRICALNISKEDTLPHRLLYINGICSLSGTLLNSVLIKCDTLKHYFITNFKLTFLDLWSYYLKYIITNEALSTA